jgi:poly(A) polymerase
VLERLPADASFPLAMAALLHDVGKPRTIGRTADRYTFYHHEHVGRRIAADAAGRLRLSNEERERIEWLVEKHQYLADAKQMRPAKLKPVLVHPGIRDLLELHRADALASGRSVEHVEFCERLLAESTEADLNPLPLVTGHDLANLGLKPGPLYRKLLDAVREGQLDGTVQTREQALELVDRLVAAEGAS